jgi:hypothetical protein
MKSVRYQHSPVDPGLAWLVPPDVPGFSGAIFTGSKDNVLEHDISDPMDAAGTVNIPGGTYRAVIDLYNAGANQSAVYSTIVHIYSGQSTPLDRTFTLAGNFADCPPKVGDPGTTLTDKLDAALASSEPDCTIVLDGTETDLAGFPSTTLSPASGNKTVTIRGNGNTIQLDSAKGSLFTLSGNLTLVLHDVTLQGLTGNTAGLVRVESEATLELRAGSRITGNVTSSPDGGGVYVAQNGTLAMSGGEVSGNTVNTYDSNVSVYNGTFTMSGDARPERVLLRPSSNCITIGGPLSGGMTVIDLWINSTVSLSDWATKPVLQLGYSGDLAALTAYFTLGKTVNGNTNAVEPIPADPGDPERYLIVDGIVKVITP